MLSEVLVFCERDGRVIEIKMKIDGVFSPRQPRTTRRTLNAFLREAIAKGFLPTDSKIVFSKRKIDHKPLAIDSVLDEVMK